MIEVQGATGNIDTNFEGKAEAAIDAYKRGKNFVYIHMEGTDECSHQGDLQGKIRCAEYRQPSGKTDSRLSERNRREIQGAGGS